MTTNRHRGLTEQAAETAVNSACRMLRLPTVRAKFPELAEAAARDQMTYRGFLAELLMAECDDRSRRRSERRIKAASFPRQKALREFDFDANPNIDPAVIHTLASCEPRPSPTRVFARPLSTASPLAEPSSRPALTPTGSPRPAPAPNKPLADHCHHLHHHPSSPV
ncbi:ATP-binding protein [Nonomuraea sp. NPDC050022]|uniref:ATP-binding protein n=1 Tax=unclassified Nonomuraea TaxID=2593643 RepID=UPI0033DCA006